MNVLNTLLAASGQNHPTKMDAIIHWIKDHMSLAGKHWSPAGFGEGPHIFSNNFTTQSFFLILSATITLILFGVLYNKKQKTPTGLTNFLEPFVIYVRDEIAVKNMGEKDGKAWTPFFCSLFFLILGSNLLGLIPGNATATGTFWITGSLALIVFLCMTLVVAIKFGPVNFIKAFMPPGVPTWVLLLLTPLEMIGLVVKCVSLTIRLFANMLAGHIVLFSIMALLYVFSYYAILAYPIAIGIYALEVFVGFLQAYVFTFLAALFIGEMFHHAHPHHDHDEEHAH
ncbi:F0F1 ATP synthase subunit A [Lentisphaera marina]|jgi:F-type H+-transporting ATPase subunit a|uniref:F0F1 ATP synthase subunit A n=1 Tax=Lentisphaera marina TaxID=1111041 RepID=UPI002366EBE8|nr:F0F1 ATP synthase subunit A [Lentisphaera marina]MDD7987429.1 F0F1 ATP synthase subunit A [Lentisphaera marina]